MLANSRAIFAVLAFGSLGLSPVRSEAFVSTVDWYSELAGRTFNSDDSSTPGSKSTEYSTVGFHSDAFSVPFLRPAVAGTVGFGDLSAVATTESGSSSGGYVIGTDISSKLTLEWNDQLTAHGTGDSGRAVLQFTLVLHDVIGGAPLSSLPCEASNGAANCGYAESQFFASGPSGSLRDDIGGEHTSSMSFIGTYDTETAFGITGRLIVGATGCTGMTFAAVAICHDGSKPSDSSTFSNACNTASFYVQSLTPGIWFSSSSGHDYTAPVPEPASVELLLAGLLGLGGAVRGRRRKG